MAEEGDGCAAGEEALTVAYSKIALDILGSEVAITRDEDLRHLDSLTLLRSHPFCSFTRDSAKSAAPFAQ